MEAVAYRLADVYDALRQRFTRARDRRVRRRHFGHAFLAPDHGRRARSHPDRLHAGGRAPHRGAALMAAIEAGILSSFDGVFDVAAATPGTFPTWQTTSATAAGPARRGSSKRWFSLENSSDAAPDGGLRPSRRRDIRRRRGHGRGGRARCAGDGHQCYPRRGWESSIPGLDDPERLESSANGSCARRCDRSAYRTFACSATVTLGWPDLLWQSIRWRSFAYRSRPQPPGSYRTFAQSAHTSSSHSVRRVCTGTRITCICITLRFVPSRSPPILRTRTGAPPSRGRRPYSICGVPPGGHARLARSTEQPSEFPAEPMRGLISARLVESRIRSISNRGRIVSAPPLPPRTQTAEGGPLAGIPPEIREWQLLHSITSGRRFPGLRLKSTSRATSSRCSRPSRMWADLPKSTPMILVPSA